MLTLRLIFLLAVVWGTTSNAASSDENRHLSRSKRGPGGLVTVLEFTQTMRGFCETIKGITTMLELYPLNAIGDVLFSLPVPVPNFRYFNPLNLIDSVKAALLSVQALVNRVNFFNLSFGKRDVSWLEEQMQDIHDLFQQQVNNVQPQGSFEFREEEEYFDPPADGSPSGLASPAPPPAPGLLMTMRDVFGLQEVICPATDFVENFLTKSPLAFLHLERLPIPLPDGEHSFNVIKAFDVYNISGSVSSVFG